MDKSRIAREVLAAIGGRDNVSASDVCMTRLRVMTERPSLVDMERLSATQGVLGIVRRGSRGIEVVFAPGKVEGVHDELVRLTGIEPDARAFMSTAGMPSSLFRVQVHPKADPTGDVPAPDAGEVDEGDATDGSEGPHAQGHDEMDDLVSMLGDGYDEGDAWECGPEPDPGAGPDPDEDGVGGRVLVINGPNINMLGIREPSIYGRQDYRALLAICHEAAREAGFADCICMQSNHEGDLVDFIQDALGSCDGIVINPGAYTHTSVAILDAVRAVSLPTIEVHISNVDEREDFRRISYVRQACMETISGMGLEGYRKAIHDLAGHLGIS